VVVVVVWFGAAKAATLAVQLTACRVWSIKNSMARKDFLCGINTAERSAKVGLCKDY
jgi:hypothetical protein